MLRGAFEQHRPVSIAWPGRSAIPSELARQTKRRFRTDKSSPG